VSAGRIRPLPLGQLVLATAAVIMAGATFADVFGGLDPVLGPVTVAASVPALVATVTRILTRRRPHLAVIATAQAAALIGAAAVVLFPAPTTVRALLEIRRAWDLVLGATPAPDRPEALLLPFLLTFVTALVTAELIWRTRRVLLVAVPPVALVAAGLAFAAGGAGGQGWTGSWGSVPVLALALLLTGLVAVRGSAFAADPRPWDRRRAGAPVDGAVHREQASALRRQRLVIGVPFVVIVTAIALPLGRSFPLVDSQPLRLREHVAVPLERDRDLNPLTRLTDDRDGERVRYRLTLRTAVPDRRVRLVALDRYDGVQWTSGATHVSAGSRLPEGPAPNAGGAAVAEVGYEVDVVDPVGPWLPTLDRPARVQVPEGVDVRVDPTTGELIVPAGPPAGLRYGAVSNVTTVDAAAVAAAGVATDAAALAAVSGHDQLPAGLADLRDEVLRPASTPFQQVALLQLFLDNDERFNRGRRFAVDPAAATGFTVGHVAGFLADADGKRVGRPELFVAAFATMARSLGLPTRIAIGFAPGAVGPGQAVEVRDRDLIAWPEVAFAGVGWVPFDVVPDDRSDGRSTITDEELEQKVMEQGDTATDQGAGEQPGFNPNLGRDESAPEPGGWFSRWWVVAAVLGVLVTGALVVLLSPVVRKWARRRGRRRVADPAACVEGAWREVLDCLASAGEGHVTALTTRRAATAVAVHIGDDAAQATVELGQVRDAALHAPAEPPPEWGARAWQLSDGIRRSARRRRTPRQRLRAALDRRPLAATDPDPDPRVAAPARPAGGPPSSPVSVALTERSPSTSAPAGREPDVVRTGP
jgi:transglutaminase-like putative cysteine protease